MTPLPLLRDLVVVFGGSLVVVLVFHRLRLPSLPGFIVAGMLLGPNALGLVADVHRAEIIRHAPLPRLVFHELIAGPLSAGTGRPGWLDDTLRPTRLYGEGGFLSFGELVADAPGLTVRIIDAAGRIRFETTLAPQR